MATKPGHPGAARFVPDTLDLDVLRDGARGCQGCDLYRDATQTVFGSGAPDADLVLVGEQPGDVEDVRGRPFVGPAGAVLRRALGEAGLDEVPTWTTNAVKHFRWKAAERGKRRLHVRPSAAQSTACRPWLAAELAAVQGRVVVALGATAGASLFGTSFRLTAARGAPVPWPPATGDFAGSDLAVAAYATIHPSAVLRAPDEERAAAYDGLVADLTGVKQALHGAG